jgi:hypothetical protein
MHRHPLDLQSDPAKLGFCSRSGVVGSVAAEALARQDGVILFVNGRRQQLR